MPDVYVGLGSNIEPERHLRRACASLTGIFGALVSSAVYRNPAVGFSGDDFHNMVVSFATEAGPDAVERELSLIERDEGRQRQAGQPGPRTLDLDLLLYGRRVDARQRLPRDDVLRYAFVLVPLAEIAPRLVHPVSGETMSNVLRRWTGSPALAALIRTCGS